MQKKSSFFQKISTQSAMITLFTGVLIAIFVYITVYMSSYNMMINDFLLRASLAYEHFESSVDKQSFVQSSGTENSDKLKDMWSQHDIVRRLSHMMRVYTVKSNSGGLDMLVLNDENDWDPHVSIHDAVSAEAMSFLETAITGEISRSSKILETDKGKLYIVCYPVRDEFGNVIGAIGMEFYAHEQYDAFVRAQIISIVLAIVLLTLSSLVSYALFKRVSDPHYVRMAFTDALTGFHNRTAFEAFAESMAQGAHKQIGILMLDLNYLKQINDESGHVQGDKYLQTAADMIRQAFGKIGSLYRIGGDEFAVIVQKQPENDVEAAIETFRRLQKEYNETGQPFDIEIACGYANFDPAVDSDFHSIFVRADDKMYTDKRRLKTERAQTLAALQGQVISWVDDRFVERRTVQRRQEGRDTDDGERRGRRKDD